MVFDVERWSAMVCDGMRQSAMVCEGERWFADGRLCVLREASTNLRKIRI